MTYEEFMNLNNEEEVKVRKGDIFYIQKVPVNGSEQLAGRPGIVVSNDKQNESSSVIQVVYTTTEEKTVLPTHVSVTSTTKPSIALCEQVNSVSKQRIGSFIGSCSKQEMDQIDKALLISFDLKVQTYDPMFEPGANETLQSVREYVDTICRKANDLINTEGALADIQENFTVRASEDISEYITEEQLEQMKQIASRGLAEKVEKLTRDLRSSIGDESQEIEVDTVADLIKSGMSVDSVAATYSVPAKSIYNLLRRNGMSVKQLKKEEQAHDEF